MERAVWRHPLIGSVWMGGQWAIDDIRCMASVHVLQERLVVHVIDGWDSDDRHHLSFLGDGARPNQRTVAGGSLCLTRETCMISSSCTSRVQDTMDRVTPRSSLKLVVALHSSDMLVLQ